MKQLREIDGNEKDTQQDSNLVKLDEQTVTREQVEKARENQGVRIIEKNPGEFKTLQKLQG